MKKIKELLTVAICALLVISPVMTETVSAAGMKESVADFTSGMRSGWVTTANGRKYQRNGKFVKGCQKVGMNYYFFNANGVLQEKHITLRTMDMSRESKKDPVICHHLVKSSTESS